MKFIIQVRSYKKDATMSEVHIGDEVFYAIEDVGRPNNIKIAKETCIPEGIYEAKITFSNRFQKETIELFTIGLPHVEKCGVKFTGIRVHAGNTTFDTEGCPILGVNTNSVDKVWNCAPAVQTAFNFVKNSTSCYWIITS
jgi:hypothetical protein